MPEVDPYPEDPIEEYIGEIEDNPDSTVDNHRSTTRRFEGWLADNKGQTILDAVPSDIRDWLRHLNNEGYAGSTIRQYHATLKSFYNEYTDNGEVSMCEPVLDENPAAFDFDGYLSKISKKADKQRRADNNEGIIYLEPSEVRDLRRHVPRPKVRNELIVKMLVQTGMRGGELRNVRVDGVDRETQIVTVPDTKTDETPKTRRVRYDDLDPELSMWLDMGYRDRFEYADSPYLFVTRESPQLGKTHLTRIIREAAKDAGIQEEWGESPDGRTKHRVTPHALRSTFTYRVIKDGGLSVPEVMELTGHERLETVQKYANVAEEDANDALEEAEVDFGTS